MIQAILFTIVAVWLIIAISKIVWGLILIVAGLVCYFVAIVLDIAAAISKAVGCVWSFLGGR